MPEKYPANRWETGGSVAPQLNSPMKKTILLTSLVLGLALAGCNRSTRTASDETTPATDPAYSTTTTAPTDTTTTTAAGTTTTAPAGTTTTTGDTLANDVRRGADATGDTMREAGRDIRQAGREAGQEMREMGREASAALSRAGNNIESKFQEWRLNAKDIEADLAADRPIVRTRADAGAPTGNMDKSTLQSAVEGRIKADSQLANLKLDVNAQSSNEIELEGKAQNASQVARAIGLALDTEGVQKVTSKIDLDDDAVKNR